MSVKVVRRKRSLLVRGKGPRQSIVMIRAHRYITSKKRFADRASYTVAVRVDRKGRYQRTLRKSRLRKGRWRITASARDGVRQARAYLRNR